jgi:radical SAM superfamily enzyme with C-terminal helix-hairpin-helix motif
MKVGDLVKGFYCIKCSRHSKVKFDLLNATYSELETKKGVKALLTGWCSNCLEKRTLLTKRREVS